MRNLIVLAAALLLSVASAVAFPRDGSVLVTDAGGTIVGVGHVAAGTTFELDLLAGFDGVVRLIFVTDAGVVVLDASVTDGVVSIDGVDLAELLAQAGFVAVRVAPAASLSDADGPDSRAALGRGNAAETAQERAGDRPNERARQGAGDGAAGEGAAGEGAAGAGAGDRDDAPSVGEAERVFPPSERPVQPPATRGQP